MFLKYDHIVMHPISSVMCDLISCVVCGCCGFDEVSKFLYLSHHPGWKVVSGYGLVNDLFVVDGLNEFKICFTG